MPAAHAMAAASKTWHQPSAMRGRALLRAKKDPAMLPRPSPARNTASIMENA